MKQLPSKIASVGLVALSLSLFGCGGSSSPPTGAEPPVAPAIPSQPVVPKPSLPTVTTTTIPTAKVPTIPVKPIPIAEPPEKIDPVTPEYDLTSGKRFIHFGDKQVRIMVTDYGQTKFDVEGTSIVDRGTSMTVGKQIPKARAHGFSRDGKWFLTSEDKTARVWEVETGKAISPPLKVPSDIRQVAISPDGKRIAIGCTVAGVYLFAVETGKTLPSPKPTGSLSPIQNLTFSPDGTMLAFSYWHGAFVWNLATATLSPELTHTEDVTTVQFSIDGKKLVTGSGDKTACIWDTLSGKIIGAPMKHPSKVHSAIFSPDGKRIATICGDNRARIWDSTSGKQIGDPIECGGDPISICFDPKGERIATSNRDRGGVVFSLATSKQICKSTFYSYGAHVSFSPDGKSVVLQESDKTKLFNAETGEEIP